MNALFLFLMRIRVPALIAGVLSLIPFPPSAGVSEAADPHGAYYSAVNNRVFWFIVASDSHIGKEDGQGQANLQWLLTEGKTVIDPSFIVLSGDITDSTNGGSFPDGPWLDEWTTYRNTVDGAGATAAFFFDVAGNHDEYNDGGLSFYRNHSVQGRATGQTQASWTRVFTFGTYHFITACTAGNDGASFNLFPPTYGDHAGLDDGELSFIENALEDNKTAELSLIFGHHPLVKPELSLETWDETALTYGLEGFTGLMNQYGVSLYGYGHTHVYEEQFFVEDMTEGAIYLNTAALGDLKDNAYTLMAVDCNGISVRSQTVGSWPLVLITCPLDTNLGMEKDPYTSNISQVGSGNPVRALVFDSNPVVSVEYRIDGLGDWLPMQSVPGNPRLWEADASVTVGDQSHVVEVRASGSSLQSDRIPTGDPPPPVEDERKGCFIETVFCR